MTPHEYKYFVLNTADSWREGSFSSLRIDPAGQLTLQPAGNLKLLSNGTARLTGLAVDKQGNIWAIDAANCHLYFYKKTDQGYEQSMCLGSCGANGWEFNFWDGSSYGGYLALGKSTLYVADTFNHRVQAFYRNNYQIRFILSGAQDTSCIPAAGTGGAFNLPRELHVDSRQRLYVLDENEGKPRIQKFNRYGRYMGILGGSELSRPVHFAIDSEDYVYVVDADKNVILKFTPDGSLEKTIGSFAESPETVRLSGIAVDGDGLIYIAEECASNVTRIHTWDQDGNALGFFESPAGPCYQLLAGMDGSLYLSSGSGGSIYQLSGGSRFLSGGVYYSKTFDSTEPETKWHRVALDADIPEKSKVEISFYASESPLDSDLIEERGLWQKALSSPAKGLEAKDALLSEGKGRCLRLKIEMIGNGATSPAIRECKLYLPRLSYLRYLPATYQEDELGSDFTERFLSLFETMNYDMEAEIFQMVRFFDPRAAREEFLDWLGSWLAIARDENWSEDKKRKLISGAYQLYQMKGTLKGLSALIKLYAETDPLIIEHFRVKSPVVLGVNASVGMSTVVGKAFTKRLVLEETSAIGDFVLTDQEDPPEKPFQVDAYDFTVFVDTSRLDSESRQNTLSRIIQEEKPAFTCCIIRTGQGKTMQLGYHTFIEVDTILSKGFPAMQLGLNSKIGEETFLCTAYPLRGIIEARSKIAIETILH